MTGRAMPARPCRVGTVVPTHPLRNGSAMDESTLAAPSVADLRTCTRCDGEQHLVGSARGMGTYRCSTCHMVVGFDLEAEPAEFLVDRGVPACYTRDVFGDRLTVDELRLGR